MYGLRMTRIAQRMISLRGRSAGAEVRRTRPGIEALEARLVLSSSGNTLYLQSNLVSDIQGMAQVHRPQSEGPVGDLVLEPAALLDFRPGEQRPEREHR